MSTPSISVDIRVKAQVEELKRAIALFKEGKISAEDLQTKAGDLNSTISAQSSAYRALTSAQRVQNFELLQGLRTLRSATSLFRDFNQVYQTVLLGQIAGNTATAAQTRAYNELTAGGTNLIDMLNVLGPANSDVTTNFNQFAGDVDKLNSNQLKTLISNMESYAAKAKLSGDEQDYFNKKMDELKQQLKETELKEQQKQFEDFFGAFSSVALLASSLGTFIARLRTMQSLKVPQVGGVPGTGGGAPTGGGPAGGFSAGGPAGIGALGLFALPFQILAMLGITPNKDQGQNSLTNRFEKAIKSLEEFGKSQTAYGDTGKTEINISFPNANLTTDFDAYKWAQDVAKAMKIEQSKRVP